MRFDEFTDKWALTPIKNLLRFQNGINADSTKYGHGVKYISVSDILNNQYITYANIKGLVDIDDSTFKRFIVEYGDIVFQRSSETFEDIGQANVYLDNKRSATFGGFVIRGKKIADYNPMFFRYLLCNRNSRKQIIKMGAGAQHYNIGQEGLERISLYFPAIKEQERIADFLLLIDKKIEVQNKIIKDRKSLILSLVFRAFCDVLTIISDFASGNALGGILNLLQLFRTIFKEVKQMVTQKNIGQIADLWKADKKQFVKKSTYAAYSLIVDTHILPAFGDKTSVGEKDVQEFVLQKLNGGLSQKTIKDMLIVLRMILKFGAKKNYCVYTPLDVIFPTDRERQELEVLSIANQKKIMRFVEENFTFRNLGIFVCLSTGMRIGEICALTWDDIDTENGVIHIRKTLQRIYIRENGIRRTELVIDTPKTATSIRDIPMTKDLLSVLKPLRKVVNEQYFVLTNDVAPTEPRTYRNYYKKLLAKLEIPPIKFHGLRHSFATRCIESHCDYKTVSVILGHSNISTTLNLYVHPNYEQKKKCIDKMLKSLK